MELCELQVGLTDPPTEPADTAGSGSLSAGAIAGIVLGGLIGLAIVCLFVCYIRWRRDFLQQQEARAMARQRQEARAKALWDADHPSHAVLDPERGAAGSASAPRSAGSPQVSWKRQSSAAAAASEGAPPTPTSMASKVSSRVPSSLMPSSEAACCAVAAAPGASALSSAGLPGRRPFQQPQQKAAGMSELKLIEEFLKSVRRLVGGFGGTHALCRCLHPCAYPHMLVAVRTWGLSRVALRSSTMHQGLQQRSGHAAHTLCPAANPSCHLPLAGTRTAASTPRCA